MYKYLEKMVDIQEKIFNKYGIDITKENIFKLYKIDKPDPSEEELGKAIEAARKRWNQSINGANEKNAERDRERLEKADKYEAVLRNPELCRSVFDFYTKGSSQTKVFTGESGGDTGFAREYFKLISTSKKLQKGDIEFFFNYYPSERKNKKAILEMLGKDFKLKLTDDAKSDEAEKEFSGKTKDQSSPLMTNLFQEATIFKLRKCVEFYEKSLQSTEVCSRYPSLREGFYAFLDLDRMEDIHQFSDYVAVKSRAVYSIRQERGTDYVPLVDLFNTLQTIVAYRDVVDNFSEFKLLVRYPELTPYMYSFVKMKPDTLKGIAAIACSECSFRNDTDFILSYYNPLYSHFGIINSGIGGILKKAEKKTRQNAVLKAINERLGLQNRRSFPIWAEIVYGLAYWPVFLVYLIFELFKLVFTTLARFTIPVYVTTFGVIFVLVSYIWFKIAGVWTPSIKELSSNICMFVKETYLDVFSTSPTFPLKVLVFIFLLSMFFFLCVLPAWFTAKLVAESTKGLNKQYDWIGYERTFQRIFRNLKLKAVESYKAKKRFFLKRKMGSVVVNLLCVAGIFSLVYFAVGMKLFDRETVQARQIEEPVPLVKGNAFDGIEADKTEQVTDSVNKKTDTVITVTVPSANIRSGPGMSNSVITIVHQGDEFVTTGKGQVSGDNTWYEIYLDDNREQTGWVSQKVVVFR